MTQKDLAEAAGLSQSYLAEIEAGKKTVNTRRLDQIAAALNCEVDLLIKGDETVTTELFKDQFSKLTDDQQTLVMAMMKSLLKE